ncbi:MAG TPA: hypothetical protein PLL86_17460 [Leptospiraceae bacterium]|nr:hypothetical protein [Leptospiraceae bacterium]
MDSCKCGHPNCNTIQFQHYRRGESTCLVCSHTEDKRLLIILTNEKTGKLAELEIIW